MKTSLTPSRKAMLHGQRVALCVKEIQLHRRTLRVLAGWMAKEVSSDLMKETGELMAVEVMQMQGWLSRLEKLALDKGEK